MTRVRGARAVVAVLWLTCHTATFALAPVLFSAGISECSCTHGADAMCPMHHKTATGGTHCAMQSTTAAGPAVLNALFSVAGLLPSSSSAIAPDSTEQAVLAEPSTITSRPSSPDLPPPRL